MFNVQCSMLIVVGCYAADQHDGLHLCSFDLENASFKFLDTVDLASPSYLTIEPETGLLYVVNELKDEQACLVAVQVEDGKRLKLLNSCKTGGASPCHVSKNNDLVATANYRGGSLSLFRISPTGEIQSLVSVIKGTTGGPDMTRQSTPHIHCVLFSPDGRYLFATDFSADQIVRLEIASNGAEVSRKEWPLAYPDGYGPRHLIFSPDGRFLYVIGELSDSVTVYEYHEGNLTEVQTIVADEDHGRGGAAIQFSPDGAFLYTSHRRKNDKIVIFSVDKQSGKLTKTGSQITKCHPRQFCLTPDGKHIFVACMDDDVIQIFKRNPATGLLSSTYQSIMVKKPAFVGFLQNAKA